MFTTILFDLDGTLTDPKPGITKSVQYALAHFGIEEEDLDTLEPFIGPPLQDSFREFYGMDEKQAWEAVEKYRERFAQVGWSENALYPGIDGMLARLKASGCLLGVASSKPEYFVKKILDHFHVAQYFDVALGSEMDGSRSKKEEVIREALLRLGVETGFSREGTVMVGDRLFDVEGAREMGLPCIGVSFGYAAPGELEESGAVQIADSVEELERILLK